MPKETDLDKKVKAFIKSQNGWCIKYWAGNSFTKKGIPDILACINGHFYGIEDKAVNGQPTLLQIKNLEWIRRAGGFGILLYPDQFDMFKQFVIAGNKSYAAELWYQKNIEFQNEWKKKLET